MLVVDSTVEYYRRRWAGMTGRAEIWSLMVEQKWSCCGNYQYSTPCTEKESHDPREYAEGEIEKVWKFYETPLETDNSEVRDAVALDCEMGTAQSGESELIRVTLIDYFTSAVLVDCLICPDAEMKSYRTQYSGVTRKDMEDARSQGTCIMGRDKARAAVLQYVGPQTVVVGHAAHNDLTALRWIHPTVVDTFLLEKMNVKAAPQVEVASHRSGKKHLAQRQGRKEPGPLALQSLARLRLDREIQTTKKGHDSLEDALAARDLAHWNIIRRQHSIETSANHRMVNSYSETVQ